MERQLKQRRPTQHGNVNPNVRWKFDSNHLATQSCPAVAGSLTCACVLQIGPRSFCFIRRLKRESNTPGLCRKKAGEGGGWG